MTRSIRSLCLSRRLDFLESKALDVAAIDFAVCEINDPSLFLTIFDRLVLVVILHFFFGEYHILYGIVCKYGVAPYVNMVLHDTTLCIVGIGMLCDKLVRLARRNSRWPPSPGFGKYDEVDETTRLTIFARFLFAFSCVSILYCFSYYY